MAVLQFFGKQARTQPLLLKPIFLGCAASLARCFAAIKTVPTILYKTPSNERFLAGINAAVTDTILYNRFLSDQHRQRRHAAYNAATAFFQGDLPHIDGGQEGALIYRDLLRGFAELPDEQRSVLLLVGVEDFSYVEAARILGVPIGTVMSRLSRGRERLRQHMAGDRANSQSLLVK